MYVQPLHLSHRDKLWILYAQKFRKHQSRLRTKIYVGKVQRTFLRHWSVSYSAPPDENGLLMGI